MKKTVTREVECCDECGRELSYETSCMKCGAVYCYDHQKTLMVEFPHAVHFSGSGDGHYCKKCARELESAGTDPLFESYMKIAALRNESERFYTDFHRRAKQAEAACSAEYKKFKKESP